MNILSIIGLKPLEQHASKVTKAHKALGLASSLNSRLHDVIELAALSYMAIGELETQTAYRSIARILHTNGELPLSRYFGMA